MKRERVLSIVKGFILIGVVLLTISCAVNPVTGGRDFMLVSEEDEIKLGRQTDAGVTKEYGLYDDQRLAAYVNEMGQRLGKLSHRPELDWHFKTLDASVVNAFAAPGGYIYFTRGILATLNSEAELAGVMGHEIGHVTARHSAQQISKAQMAQYGLTGLSIGLQIFGIPDVSSLAQLGVGTLFLKFSRDNEREADSLGVEYATKAGYDAAQMADFFETLQRMDSKSDRSGLPSWFSTHPSPEDRENAIRTQSKQMQQKMGLRDPKIDREDYLKIIDGMIYGDDPRQGYAEEGVYYHPGMRFQFPVPAEWKSNDTPAAVQMVSKKKDAVILFFGASGSSPAEAASNFITKTNARIIRSESRSVNGLPSQQILSEVRSRQGVVRTLSFFIQKERQIFVFHGLSSARLFPQYEQTFSDTFSAFEELKDPEKINVQPDRIRARFTKKTETIENALRSLGVPDDKLKDVVVLNGGTPGQTLPANTLIKIVEYGR
ncbi:MAG: M48 family metalloprotease [Deltaproteobacteria bacterium]|nr:M48 family metalloprotease [Deltaproteobacteria bacterium]